MSFRDQLSEDLNTFINTNEFADMHDIDGKQVPALIDADILKERPRYVTDRSLSDGIYIGSVTIFVREDDLGYRPVCEQILKVDGRLLTVKTCDESEGILEIVLEANEA